MSDSTILNRRLLWFAVVFGVWTLIGLLDAVQIYLQHAYVQEPIAWWIALLAGVTDWYIWAALTPLIVFLAREVPCRQRLWPARLAFHSAAGLIFSLFVITLSVPVVHYLRAANDPERRLTFANLFQILVIAKLHLYFLIYWVILGVCHALDYYRKYRERELKASRLETQLAQAQLQALKTQLHPHFLFNTLNAISALMHNDVEAADRLTARLGELLRSTLENGGAPEVALEQELQVIKPYLEIEQARLGPRLSVQMDIARDTLGARVPNFILQPLVESAIRHGTAACSAPGRVGIRARRVGVALQLQVRDSNAGPPRNGKAPRAGPAPPEAVPDDGLEGMRSRLERLYGTDHRFETRTAADGGRVVTVTLPFRDPRGGPSDPTGISDDQRQRDP